jgi:hypothetical protein
VLSTSSQATFFLAIFTIKQPFLFLADGMITEPHDWTIINTTLKTKSLAVYMASENKKLRPNAPNAVSISEVRLERI